MTSVADVGREDLLGLTAALVAVPSESHHEAALADVVEARLRARAAHLDIVRVGHNIVARTRAGRERRVVLGGHLDTVPANGNAAALVDGDRLAGLGSADMKGGLAVLLGLAERASAPAFDVTFVFYECEEVADEFNGLRTLFGEAPALLDADLAILLEPTDGWVEAGCQGTIHARAMFVGTRAHTARPWTGSNAVHRAAPLLARLASYEAATVEVDGLEYREALQVVRVEGGIANNVVPDRCTVTVNRRYAPSRPLDDAVAELVALLDDADEVEVTNASPAAPPNLANPLVADFVARGALAVRPKLGWTDVARFASRGIPALNFGPGDPLVAHTAEEFVTGASLRSCADVLARFVGLD